MKLLFENWRKYLNEKKFEDYAAEKGAWVELPVTDLQHQDNVDLTKELYDLIAAAFAKEPQGHFDFQSPADIPSDYTYWKAVDIDSDPAPDALVGGKHKGAGTKMAVSGHDGSGAGKAASSGEFSKLFNMPGYYGEVSKALAHVMLATYGVPYVDSQERVESVLGKKVKWVGAHPKGKYPGYDGWYTRKIGGVHEDMKIMIGKPNA